MIEHIDSVLTGLGLLIWLAPAIPLILRLIFK